jgi:hypothetical protein
VLTWKLLEVTCGRVTRHTDADVDKTIGPIWGDMCHHCKGDTWHARTTYMEGTTRGRHADREDNVVAWKI